MRRAKKIDANQPQIVEDLLTIPGISVELDCNDILVGYKGNTYWFEIKNPDTVSPKTNTLREGEITDSEKKRRDTWRGHYRIIWTLGMILEDMGIKST